MRPLRPPSRTVPFCSRAIRAAVAVLIGLSTPAVLQSQVAGPAAEQAGGESGANRFWLGLGVGGAGSRITCDLCDPGRDVGPSLEVAIGSYARPDLRIGVEGGGWTHDDDGSRESVYRVGVIAYLRPDPTRGRYLVGGFGWNHYEADAFRYDAPRVSLGVGWDHPLGDGLRVGNQLTLSASSFGTLRNGETVIARNVGLSLLGISVTLYRP